MPRHFPCHDKSDAGGLWHLADKGKSCIFADTDARKSMEKQVIFRFVTIGLLWLGVVGYLLTHARPSLYLAFVVIASAIIVFVPMYKKYVKK